MSQRGVVIGKFYPPHKGHEYLITKGLAEVDQLTVIVCDKKGQSIPGELRAAWLREMVPQATVVVVDDVLDDADSKGWAEFTIKILGYRPDVVFTSEKYGDNYVKFLGARHVLIDFDRKTVPICATSIRKDPLSCWEHMSPCVRAHFAKRVCIVGAESTGKTTMAKALGDHYQTTWVPEYGRMYFEGRWKSLETDAWRTDEFVHIARQQNTMEDAFARSCRKILFCDTDSFATSLWHERYVGKIAKEVDDVSAGRQCNLYFLADVDIPFVQDGLRDGEKIRHSMHERFRQELERRKKPFVVLSGSHERRMKMAVEACDKLMASESR
jgi:HTH-type transcriptional regulator, transcriptional repressor of NAD biosynthesis genes